MDGLRVKMGTLGSASQPVNGFGMRHARGWRIPSERPGVQTLDEMLSRKLLTPRQHADIRAWIHQARTVDRILAMPEPLWRSFALASVLMNVDADLTQPPLLSAGA
jgi:hypothetical protein